MIKKILAIVFLVLIFGAPARAFSFKKSEPRPTTSMTETSQYRILFSFEKSSRQKDKKTKSRFVELSYKYADLEEPPGQRFAGEGGGRIRFLDKDGFALASDVFTMQDLETGDHYGFLWIEEKRAGEIVSADTVSLRPEELHLLQKVAEEPPAEENPETETLAAIQPEESPSPLPSPSPEPVVPAEPPPSAEPAPSPSPSASPLLSPSPSLSSSPSPIPSDAADSLQRGGVSNEELAETLTEQEKNPVTEIPPSATKLEMPVSPQPETETQEDDKNGVIIKQTFV